MHVHARHERHIAALSSLNPTFFPVYAYSRTARYANLVYQIKHARFADRFGSLRKRKSARAKERWRGTPGAPLDKRVVARAVPGRANRAKFDKKKHGETRKSRSCAQRDSPAHSRRHEKASARPLHGLSTACPVSAPIIDMGAPRGAASANTRLTRRNTRNAYSPLARSHGAFAPT